MTSKTTLKFSAINANGLRECGPFAIERIVNDSGSFRRFDVSLNGEVFAKAKKVGEAVSHAEGHWAALGCPAFDDASGDLEGFTLEAPVVETDSEVLDRIQRSFRVMRRLVGKTITGKFPSLIISGPGGIGKSHPTKEALRAAVDNGTADYVEMSGKCSGPGLFKALHAMKDGGIVLIDDCDSVFEDTTSLNLLKAALDSSDRRLISWLSQATWIESEGLEEQFEFKGQVIFITNIDFDREIEKGTKRSVHLEALLSRSVLMDLDIKSQRDLLLRIEDMVMNVGMVDKFGLTAAQKQDLVDFMKEHASKFRSLTLREAVKLAKMIVADDSAVGDEWRDEALVTLAKGRRTR